MGSNNIRVYPDPTIDAQSPYPIPMMGSAQSPSLCSDDITEPCPSSTDSDWSPGGSVAELQFEAQQNSLEYPARYSPSREYPRRQDNILLHSDWTRSSNISGAHLQGIVCPKEVQIQTYADEEEGDMAYDESNFKAERSFNQEQSDTIVLAPMESQCSRYADDGCDISASANSPADEEDDDDDACSSYSGRREMRARREIKTDSRPKRTRPIRKDSKILKPGRVTKHKKEEWRCQQHAKQTFKNQSDYRKHMHTQHTRPFLCTFYFAECGQHFGSKNEWKRHVHSQHLQLGYWQCDYAACADRSGSNFFNRKDLFTQHLRRMHLPKAPAQSEWQSSSRESTIRAANQNHAAEQQFPEIWKRCYRVRREAPTNSTCGYCGKKFQGIGSWDDRMEHVGHHYENSQSPVKPSDWKEDKELIGWMLKEGLIRRKDEDTTMTDGSEPPRYTVFGLGNKPSRRRSDDEFLEADKRRFSPRAYPQRPAVVEVDATSDMDAEAEEED
ncbi:hypothetical protein FGG08_000814 [Glutinoglossum americanum]|uniref:C2H2-type domain-containing protein n=1 Tax=Glutinoglossum americanum TaxID=1670608 RepID=A0A9P8ICL5_9PEZI|nr:hypothetical protein FGG08_000814 [Glutinoglossum americanum]